MKVQNKKKLIFGLLGLSILVLIVAYQFKSPLKDFLCSFRNDTSGKIAFVSKSNWGNISSDVYVMDADGCNPISLETGIFMYVTSSPVWSPDGKKIAFVAAHDIDCTSIGGTPGCSGSYERDIYVVNADLTDLVNLTNYPATYDSLDWSPDGQKIAFVSNRDGSGEIYLMDVDGSNLKRITYSGGVIISPSVSNSIAWSPDGKNIAFNAVLDQNSEIYIMDADGSNLVNLTNHPSADTDPAWSPDGQKIAFVSSRDRTNEIYVMDVDGNDLVKLSGGYFPVWSPDGQKIAYRGHHRILVMNADGSNRVRLAENSVYNSYQVWSPDSQQIVYYSKSGIFKMDADGSIPVRLTNNNKSNDNHSPSWAP